MVPPTRYRGAWMWGGFADAAVDDLREYDQHTVIAAIVSQLPDRQPWRRHFPFAAGAAILNL